MTKKLIFGVALLLSSNARAYPCEDLKQVLASSPNAHVEKIEQIYQCGPDFKAGEGREKIQSLNACAIAYLSDQSPYPPLPSFAYLDSANGIRIELGLIRDHLISGHAESTQSGFFKKEDYVNGRIQADSGLTLEVSRENPRDGIFTPHRVFFKYTALCVPASSD